MENLDPFSIGNTTQRILVASQDLLDPVFRQTLVFMCGHDEEGAMGLVLNRPTGKTLDDILDDDESPPFLKNVPLYFGGPVRAQEVLLVVFSWSECGGKVECVCSPEQDVLSSTFDHPRHEMRAFLGCAGWGSGQLESELREGSWRVTEPHPLMFREPYSSKFWRVLESGDERWRGLIDKFPDDPGQN